MALRFSGRRNGQPVENPGIHEGMRITFGAWILLYLTSAMSVSA
jgi:hypothetical protein